MDPLSVAANIIAVVGAANTLVERLEELRRLHNTPVQLLQVLNEISDMQTILAMLQETWTQFKDQAIAPEILYRLERTMEAAKALLDHFNEILEPHSSKKLFARWRTGRGDIQRHLERLQHTRRDINEILSILTVSELPQVRIELDRIGLINEDIGVTSKTIGDNLDQYFDLVQTTTQQLLTMVNTIREPPPTPIGDSVPVPPGLLPQDPGIYVTTSSYRQSPCRHLCVCRCHAESRLQSPRWTEALIGKIFIGYTGVPYLNYTSCNEETCMRERSRLVRVNYYFPKWFFLGRVITFREWSNPLEGSCLSIRTPRLVHRNSEVLVHASLGHVSRLQVLFSQGLASPFDIGNDGESLSPLLAAVGTRHAECCRFLLSQYSDLGYDAGSGNAKEIALKYLLENNTDPKNVAIGKVFEPFDEVDDTRNWSLTPIHMIVLGFSTIDLESYLSLSTIEINSQDRFGRTALMWACRRNDPRVVQTLLSFGARLDIVSNVGNTAFNEAMWSASCLAVLLTALERYSTYDPKMSPFTGTSMFNLSPRNLPDKYIGNDDACRELLNKPNSGGCSALWKTIETRNVTGASLLIQHGADLNTGENTDPPQGTPLLIAVQLNHPVLIKLLVDSGARTDVKDPSQQSILHLAAQWCDYNTISLLATLELKGLNLDDCDEDGFTAWQLFDQFRPLYNGEDPAMRSRSKKAFERLVESTLPSEPSGKLKGLAPDRDFEEESLNSDSDEFFDVECKNILMDKKFG